MMDALTRVPEARHRISEQFDCAPRRLVEYYIEKQKECKDRLVSARQARTGNQIESWSIVHDSFYFFALARTS